MEDDNFNLGKTPIICDGMFQFGNEMKYLEDANWGQCSNHNEGINPNVESAVVLNLSEQKEGESPLTVYYFVNQKVEIGMYCVEPSQE
jgi:hypothetical protein